MCINRLISPLLLVSLAGCAQHYLGSVIDVQGRPVAYARVEGHGMHGGMLTGKGPFAVSTVADGAGHFDLVSSDWPSDIIATSPDSKHSGGIFIARSRPPYVVTVR
jgi:hypothetical protein